MARYHLAGCRGLAVVLAAVVGSRSLLGCFAVTVSGSLEATFQNGIVACDTTTELALQASIASALTEITGTSYSSGDVSSVAVNICSRRLDQTDSEEEALRRLAAIGATVSYDVAVATASFALEAMSALASSPAAFAAEVGARMGAASIALFNIVVGPLSSSESLAFFSSLSMSVLGSFPGDGMAAISASRWRVVGRGVASEWVLFRVGFFEDVSCTRAILTIPQRNTRGFQRYNGRAFGSPTRRGRPGHNAADVFEAAGGEWRSTAPCGEFSDTCHIGFDWLTDQVAGPAGTPASSFQVTGVVRRFAVEPRCILLVQSEVPGQFAPTVAVQYKANASPWETLTTRAGLVGGPVQLRQPVVA